MSSRKSKMPILEELQVDDHENNDYEDDDVIRFKLRNPIMLMDNESTNIAIRGLPLVQEHQPEDEDLEGEFPAFPPGLIPFLDLSSNFETILRTRSCPKNTGKNKRSWRSKSEDGWWNQVNLNLDGLTRRPVECHVIPTFSRRLANRPVPKNKDIRISETGEDSQIVTTALNSRPVVTSGGSVVQPNLMTLTTTIEKADDHKDTDDCPNSIYEVQPLIVTTPADFEANSRSLNVTAPESTINHDDQLLKHSSSTESLVDTFDSRFNLIQLDYSSSAKSRSSDSEIRRKQPDRQAKYSRINRLGSEAVSRPRVVRQKKKQKQNRLATRMPEDKRKKQLEKSRIYSKMYYRRKRAAETPEERKEFLMKLRAYRQRIREKSTPEELEARRRKYNEWAKRTWEKRKKQGTAAQASSGQADQIEGDDEHYRSVASTSKQLTEHDRDQKRKSDDDHGKVRGQSKRRPRDD